MCFLINGAIHDVSEMNNVFTLFQKLILVIILKYLHLKKLNFQFTSWNAYYTFLK